MQHGCVGYAVTFHGQPGLPCTARPWPQVLCKVGRATSGMSASMREAGRDPCTFRVKGDVEMQLGATGWSASDVGSKHLGEADIVGRVVCRRSVGGERRRVPRPWSIRTGCEQNTYSPRVNRTEAP